jgi:hypothetical protein
MMSVLNRSHAPAGTAGAHPAVTGNAGVGVGEGVSVAVGVGGFGVRVGVGVGPTVGVAQAASRNIRVTRAPLRYCRECLLSNSIWSKVYLLKEHCGRRWGIVKEKLVLSTRQKSGRLARDHVSYFAGVSIMSEKRMP